MIAKITLYNGVVYKIGDKTQDTSDGLYAGRIVDELQIESKMSDKGATPLSLNITIRNDDNFIPNTVDLWAATIELTATNGNKWVGKINFFDFDADGNVYITASEKTAPELELQLPDEVRQVYTVDNNFHPSSTSMTIPLVVGGTASAPITLSTILIDKQNGVYLIGTGEIRQILKVYNGSEELPASAYTAYTGTASQSEHAGFAYVKINEAYRKNADGTYAEINVDIIGLKLGSYSAEECRNPARFLYYFLTTPSSGVNGWGCGISASDIDSASFNSAITLCDTLGYKLDGIMWLRQSAQSWIDQICQTMHASYTIGANGKRTLFIDYAGAASKRTFTENDCKVSRYGKNSYSGQVYNKGVLSYGYNPITGLFMQSAQFEDSASVSQIGEQKFVGESYLIGDASTALKVLEYTCKRSLISAEAIEFETDRLETLLKAGDLITLNFPSRNINAVYQIANISTSEYKSSISAVKFDTSVFTVSGSKTNVAWGKDRDITPALTPAQATNLLLSTGFDINPDGTGNPYISGTFTVPDGGWLAAAVQYGIGTNPSNWTEMALITEGRFKIQPVNVYAVYTVRIRMITATGHSDYITGQITSTGDTVPPAIPTIVLNSTEKSVIVKCAIDNPPSDMGGFQIWRKKHTEEVFTLVGNVAANFGYASFPDHVETFVEYDYKAKSYDRSGNLSDFSQVESITPTGLEATEIAATAIKIPTGSILNINAKGSTTESIKTANGVIDGSGFGHHGQAYGGVSVLDGGEGFSFDGNNGYLKLREYSSLLQQGEAWTIVGRFKPVAGAVNIYPRMFGTTKYNIEGKNANPNSMKFNVHNGTTQTQHSLGSDFLPFDEEHHAVFVQDGETLIIYKDGVEFTRIDCGYVPVLGTEIFFVGKQTDETSQYFKGTIKDFRIYPRALSATEVKSMYMLSEDVVLTRVTADVIGANAVNAIHLNAGSVTANAVGTNEIITNVANISQAVVNNLNVSGNATFTALSNKVTANYGTCSTAAATVAKVVTLSNFVLYTGAQISVKFTYANTAANPTLNVNSTGAKAIYAKNAAIAGNYNWVANDVVSFTYNGSQWVATSVSGIDTAISKASSDATTKADTAQSNAISTAASNAAAKVKVVTDNIYSANTTTINGGKITTGTITTNAMSAGSITAEKITVTAGSLPTNPSIVLKAQAGYFASGSYVGDTSGQGMRYKLSAAFTSYNSSALGYMWRRTSMAASAIVLDANQTVTVSASFTFSIIYNITDWSAQPVFFDAKAADNANRVTIYATTGRVVKVNVYDANGTATTITLGTCTNSAWRRLTVVCKAGAWTSYDSAYTASTATETVSATTAAHAALTATALAFGNLAASASASRGFIGYLGHIFVYNYALSKDQHFSLVKHGMTRELGTITTDRIATDAIKSRTLSGGGNAAFTTSGMLINLAGNGYISSRQFYIDNTGNAVFKGQLSAASGSFSGTVTTNNLTATAGTIGGVKIENGTASGLMISDMKAQVVETGKTSTSWYKKYSDGFIEQGGITNDFAVTATHGENITFPKPFVSPPLVVTGAPKRADNDQLYCAFMVGVTSNTKAYIFIGRSNNSGGANNIYWYACGY